MPPDNASEPLRVVILNDTSQRYHHGCSRVMRLLVDGLVRHGMTVTARSPARHEWQNDAGFLDHMKDASLVVINGEGTLHHGRPAGADLLAVTAHPAAKNCAIAVVNALYQDNPDDWGKHLAQCDLLSARDAKSAAEMQRVCGEVPVRVVADLSLTDGAQIFDGPRNGILFGDSVKWNVRRAMALASMRIGADAFLPIKTLGNPFWRFPLARKLLYWAYNGVFGFRTPKFLMSKSEDAYLRDISKTAMHVTGRFHSVCLSIVTGTPFMAVGSNSWKIQALLEEVGLDPDRIISLPDLSQIDRETLNRPFNQTELQNIEQFLAHAKSDAEALFADLATLAARRTK